jgi:hypothetical protein
LVVIVGVLSQSVASVREQVVVYQVPSVPVVESSESSKIPTMPACVPWIETVAEASSKTGAVMVEVPEVTLPVVVAPAATPRARAP